MNLTGAYIGKVELSVRGTTAETSEVPVTTPPEGETVERLEVLTGQVDCDSRVVAPLFVADRLDHLLRKGDGLLALVEGGTDVLCDRYYFSSYAYQSVDLPLEWVIGANRPCADLLRPDATLFLDVDPELALERIARGRDHTELFETRERLTRTREQYFRAFEAEKGRERILILPGDQSPEALSRAIWDRVAPLL